MARALKKINWKQVALITAVGFAWTKLGVGTAVTEVMPEFGLRPRCPTGQTAKFFDNPPRYVCVPKGTL